MISHQFFSILTVLFLLATTWSQAKAPAAPSGLKVKAVGVNSFKVQWKDNSTNEAGWEFLVNLKGSPPRRFLLVPAPNITSYTIITNDLPGKEVVFQMKAYNGVAGAEKFSKPTPIVAVKALSPTTFGAPKMLKAKVLDDGRIRLGWKDKATSESGYEIQFRVGKAKKWQQLGNMGPGTRFTLPLNGLSPATNYSFRVRAFKGNPVRYTAYSNIAKAKTRDFGTPSELTATPSGEGAFIFNWKDNSSLEQGVDLQRRTGSGEFVTFIKAAGVDFTETEPISGFSLDTNYDFRLRVYRLVGTTEVFSDFSNVFSIRSASMNAPANFAGTVVNNTDVKLTWKDMSAYENGYELEYREVGTTDFSVNPLYSQQEAMTLTDFPPNKHYEFRIRAFSFFQPAKSAYSDLIRLQTKDTLTSNLAPPVVVGSQFLYQIQSSTTSALTGVTVTGLPAGLVLNSTSRTITGTLATAGTYNVTITATYADGSKSVRTLVLKSVSPSPVASQAFAAVNVAAAANRTVSLTGKFSDPDTLSAARVTTNLGNFDIILFPTSTPRTNENFLDYIDAGSYDDSFFHRSPVDFVVQGGGYKHTEANGYSRIETFPPVVNEPGLSNVRGTVAMAKVGGDPNSATSQWFVNVGNNSGAPPLGLDFQNGGFTVFGRVPASGMTVVDAINNLPVADYSIPIGAGTDLLENVPVNADTAPVTLDPTKLVKISSMGPAPILIYQVQSQNTAVATAALNSEGTEIIVTGVAAGSTTIQVTATDLDGNTVSQNISVTVP